MSDQDGPYADEKKLLKDFLAAKPRAREELPARFESRLLAIARNAAPDLNRDGLSQDVVQQTYLLLMKRRPAHFDEARSDSVWPYLYEMVRLAIRDVQVANSYPGASSRARCAGKARAVAPLSYDQLTGHYRNAVGASLDLTAPAAISAVALASICGALSTAPSWIVDAAVALAAGASLLEVAELVGRSRFAVRRGLNRWVKPLVAVEAEC